MHFTVSGCYLHALSVFYIHFIRFYMYLTTNGYSRRRINIQTTNDIYTVVPGDTCVNINEIFISKAKCNETNGCSLFNHKQHAIYLKKFMAITTIRLHALANNSHKTRSSQIAIGKIYRCTTFIHFPNYNESLISAD